MSISVTENVSSVTDVMALLSSLGFDAGEADARVELHIDRFDQWGGPMSAKVYGSPCVNCQIWDD